MISNQYPQQKTLSGTQSLSREGVKQQEKKKGRARGAGSQDQEREGRQTDRESLAV